MRLRRIYVNNFRGMRKFEVKFEDASDNVILGKNGVGKSTLRNVLELMKAIACGENSVEKLLSPKDFSFSNANEPLRIELECTVNGDCVLYSLAFDFPPGFRKLRVLDERLSADGSVVFMRELGQITLPRNGGETGEVRFNLDWHSIALPIIHLSSDDNPLGNFLESLRRMLILAPVPSRMVAESQVGNSELSVDCSNFATWLSELLGEHPDVYTDIRDHLLGVMPDFKSFRGEKIGVESKRLMVSFADDGRSGELPFDALSDGEKCQFVCAAVSAYCKAVGSVCCFWDEPDNFLALSEVKRFVTVLKRGFSASCGQLVVTSHNAEAIMAFPCERSLVLFRDSHLEPIRVKSLAEIAAAEGGKLDLAYKLISGDLYDVE